jgi:hypothetical protein
MLCYYDFGKKQENCTHFSEVISGDFDIACKHACKLMANIARTYCFIVEEKSIYQWILSDFSFDDGSG